MGFPRKNSCRGCRIKTKQAHVLGNAPPPPLWACGVPHPQGANCWFNTFSNHDIVQLLHRTLNTYQKSGFDNINIFLLIPDLCTCCLCVCLGLCVGLLL